MKRNGDVRLACLSLEVKAALQAAEVGSLFHSFAAISDAVESFHKPQFDFIQLENPALGDEKSEMNAA